MKSVGEIVARGLCIGCGVCAYSDAIGGTRYCSRRGQFVPALAGGNRDDLLAYRLCPGKGYDIVADAQSRYREAPYDVELGRALICYAAHSNDPAVLARASSGGVVSEIALYLLETGAVDAVLTTVFRYTQDGPRAVGILAQSREEILAAQGSKYCPVDISHAVRAMRESDCRVAVIGTPCHVAGIRNLQRHDPSLARKVVIAISNFCGGVKSYRNVERLARAVGIGPGEISSFRFRGGGQPGSMVIEARSGRRAELPYPAYVGMTGVPKHLRCHLCVDATAELADLACGDAWLERFLLDPSPWSVALCRNRLAQELVQSMAREGRITCREISPDEVKRSQQENLRSKKARQSSRMRLYRMLGYPIPAFDGGYHPGGTDLRTEAGVLAKHKLKEALESLHLFGPVWRGWKSLGSGKR